MDILKKVPVEIENKIFYFVGEHPLANIFKEHITVILDEDNVLIIQIRDPHIVKERTVELRENEEASQILDRKIQSCKMYFRTNYSLLMYLCYGIRDNGSDIDSDIYDFNDSP
jgi:hypothetical protein